jgi:SNF2 family DNA or RNA helicase
MLLYDRVDKRFPNATWSLLRKGDDFGIPVFDLAGPPQRFYRNLDQKPPLAFSNLDARQFTPQPTLAKRTSRPAENPSAEANRVIGKLASWFLVCEDRQNRLEKRPVQTLAHQASLVRYVLDAPHLQKVLVGDEVGLGKTIEAGLILQELLSRDPNLRICYFAPARLVTNVCREFDQLELKFRKWSRDRDANADLKRDTRIVASINRACLETNARQWINGDPWDILIVDECHHLSNYDPDGYSPGQQYALVQALVQRQPPTGRLILMSGTPHQGHPERFRNLLRLISELESAKFSR